MKASFRKSYGPFNNIEVVELEIPKPKPREILVRIHATTVNRTDTAVVTGKPFLMRFFAGFPYPRYVTPGTDFAGIIEEVGVEVNNYKIGDKIFGFNDNGLGTQAEYACISTKQAIAKIPNGFSFTKAAASLEGAHYAINFLNKVDLKPTHNVMINGATGAIGSAALQFVKNIGCKVNAVANAKNIEKIKELGAAKVFNYEEEDFTQVDMEKYHFIFDAVGKSSFGKCAPLLEDKGIYISSELGPKNENPLLALRSKFYGNKKVIFPFPSDIPTSINKTIKLIEKGSFNPLIDRSYRLEDIVTAYHYVQSGQKTGNVILDLSTQ